MDREAQLFDSVTEPVPRFRYDLSLIPVKQNGNTFLYIQDTMGYAPEDLALKAEVQALLTLFDGRHSVEDLRPVMGEGVTDRHLLDFIQFLDRHRLLDSPWLRKCRDEIEGAYEAADMHTPVTAGSSFSSDPAELKRQLNDAMAELPAHPEGKGTIKALYAPHIDPRVSKRVYAESFSRIAHLRPKRIVVLATSHFSGLFQEFYGEYPFILVDKGFRLPNGTVPVDREMVCRLKESAGDVGLSTHDRAHRMEHSIELHMVWLRHMWDHDFRVVPVLVNSLEELYYMRNGHRGKQLDSFAALLRELFGGEEDTLFLVSGDLSHTGRKFGDPCPARDMINEVRSFDRQFMDKAAENRRDELLSLMSHEYDPYRICGFPPLFTLLETFPDLLGEPLNYERWDEQERESAVTFGSILYR